MEHVDILYQTFKIASMSGKNVELRFLPIFTKITLGQKLLVKTSVLNFMKIKQFRCWY